MNILVLADNFSKGGLETQIDTFYKRLRDGHNIIYGFGGYTKGDYLKGALIIDGFHFNSGATIKDFCNDVERIKDIIIKNNIDVIHVHPFYAIYPAVFAANAKGVKIVYSYHGRLSINFPSYYNDAILFDIFMETIINKVFCVSKKAVNWFDFYRRNQALFFPNLIDEEYFSAHKPAFNKRWALISRLDEDKLGEIKEVISMLPQLDIDILDIYGEGSAKKEINSFIKKLSLSKRINIKGYSSELEKDLNNYTGVMGIGRVALESLVMNYPTIIIGYGKVYGIINKSLFSELMYENFVPVDLKPVDALELNQQIKRINNGMIKEYQLRREVIKHFGRNRINDYIDQLNNSRGLSLTVFEKIYSAIMSIENSKDLFYTSKEVFYILDKYISGYTNNPLLKRNINLVRQIVYFDEYINSSLYNLNYKIENEILVSKNGLSEIKNEMYALNNTFQKNCEGNNNEISQLEKEVSLLKNTSLLTLLKRDFTKIVYRIKNIFGSSGR